MLLAILAAAAIAATPPDPAPTDPATIRVAADRAELANCERLDQIQARSVWGGFGDLGGPQSEALKRLKKAGAKIGATHVLLIDTASTSAFTSMIADAYRCSISPAP